MYHILSFNIALFIGNLHHLLFESLSNKFSKLTDTDFISCIASSWVNLSLDNMIVAHLFGYLNHMTTNIHEVYSSCYMHCKLIKCKMFLFLIQLMYFESLKDDYFLFELYLYMLIHFHIMWFCKKKKYLY